MHIDHNAQPGNNKVQPKLKYSVLLLMYNCLSDSWNESNSLYSVSLVLSAMHFNFKATSTSSTVICKLQNLVN